MGPATESRRQPRMLWVEGKDDSAIVQSLCAAHLLPHAFGVEDKGGAERVLDGFYVELRAAEVERFGLVVDANGDAAGRWRAIRNRLLDEGYAEVPETLAPDGMIVRGTEHRPRFGAWIMPDNGSAGAVEEFAAALVPAGDRLWEHAVAAVAGIPTGERRFPELRRRKAEVHTWPAWQEYPGSPMGQAIGKGDLDGNAPLAVRFVTWLRRLMLEDDPPAARP